MNFEYTFADARRRYALGVDHASGRQFLSFILMTPMCEYEEFYAISPLQALAFQSDASVALRFAAAMHVAQSCEFGEPEELLIISILAGQTKPRNLAPIYSPEIAESRARHDI